MDDKERRNKLISLIPPVIGALLILLAIAGGTLIARHTARKPVATPEPTSKVIVVPARTPRPSNTPTISALRLFALGTPLGPDGFTTYVGDKPLTLTVEITPSMINPPVYWTFSDPSSVSLSVGDDHLTCKLTALKPSGKNELTVRCYGTEMTIPVYLWER